MIWTDNCLLLCCHNSSEEWSKANLPRLQSNSAEEWVDCWWYHRLLQVKLVHHLSGRKFQTNRLEFMDGGRTNRHGAEIHWASKQEFPQSLSDSVVCWWKDSLIRSLWSWLLSLWPLRDPYPVPTVGLCGFGPMSDVYQSAQAAWVWKLWKQPAFIKCLINARPWTNCLTMLFYLVPWWSSELGLIILPIL